MNDKGARTGVTQPNKMARAANSNDNGTDNYNSN